MYFFMMRHKSYREGALLAETNYFCICVKCRRLIFKMSKFI